jgi:hypothetical protein
VGANPISPRPTVTNKKLFQTTPKIAETTKDRIEREIASGFGELVFNGIRAVLLKREICLTEDGHQ